MSFDALRANITKKFDSIASDIAEEITTVQNQLTNNLITPLIGDAQSLFSSFSGFGTTTGATSSPGARVSAYPGRPSPLPDPVPPSQFIPGTTPPPWPNELQDFSTFNVIMELAVLSAEEINDPDGTYRKDGPKNVVIRNGGGAAGKKVRTAYEEALGKDVEFFIDDLEFDALINDRGNANTNANKFKFAIHEPYSMGLFLQALQLAATTAGYKDYIGAPVLLTLDFIGYDNENRSGRAPYARRMLPLRLTGATFRVDAGGSIYDCEALAWNEIALMDLVQSVKNDITISGTNVQELLQSGIESMTAILTEREIEEQARGIKSTGDHYVVMFPTNKASAETNPIAASEVSGGTATIDPSTLLSSGVRSDLLEYYRSIRGTPAITPEEQGFGEGQVDPALAAAANQQNATAVPEGFDEYVAEFQQRIAEQSQLGSRIQAFAESSTQTSDIGKAKIIDSFVQGGSHPFGRNGYVLNEETGVYERNGVELTLSGDLRTFKFKAGTRIQDIITEIVVVSEFGQSIAQQLENITDPTGMVNWFKVETQVYSIPDNAEVDRSGKTPSVFVFRVVPYQVHHSIFMAPTTTGVGYGNLKQQAAKQYNYIYTGKNQDLLDFTIEYNKQFYTVQRADAGNASASTRVGAANQAVQTNPEQPNVQGGTPNPHSPAEGVAETQQSVSVGESSGGGEIDNSAIAVARMFQEQFNNSAVDLVKLTIEIMGDPFYISDSGLGNYNAGDTSYRNMNTNGTMNSQSGEVDINILFRTPIDYNASGTMDFPEDTKIVEPFSGLYRVTKVHTSISSGEFKQRLVLLRRRNQEEEEVTSNVGAFRRGQLDESLNDAVVALQTASNNLASATPEAVAQSLVALNSALPMIQELGTASEQAQAALNSGILQQLNAVAGEITGQLEGPLADQLSALSGQLGDSFSGISQQLNTVAGGLDLDSIAGTLNVDSLAANIDATLGSLDIGTITSDFNAALAQANSAAASATSLAQQELSNIGNDIRSNLPSNLSGPF